MIYTIETLTFYLIKYTQKRFSAEILKDRIKNFETPAFFKYL